VPLLTVSNLVHAYGAESVLDGASFSIEAGEKVGLVGRNGTGKTTLLRAILGTIEPVGGSVQRQRGIRVGYLSQDPELDPADTVRDAAEGAFAELHRLHLELNALFEAMADAAGAELDRMLRKQARLEAAMEAAGGYAVDHRIDATLHGLGFPDDQFALRVDQLSGGQKGRLGLARLLLEEPDLLLLDEPTNHLDIVGRQWLERFLAEEYPGAVVVISHDRWLLDRVVHRIIEIERGVIRDYPGSYHKYAALRLERQLTQARVHEKQQDHIRREQAYIRRYKAGQRAKQARGRESRLERFKAQVTERPAELEVMRLQLPKAPRSGEQVLAAEGLAKAYGDLVLFRDLDLDVQRGERIGIIGPNGIGKTTLVRCLLGDVEPDAGRVRRGSRISVGYYRQLHDHLDLSLTVWQYLQSVIVALDGQARASEQQARDLAGAFLFSGDEQDKRLAELSGGERSRAVLAGLIAGAHNLLVLDEPSNHLDIPSAERLEAALSLDGGYDGTVLLISHDRALLQATCTRLIVFEGDAAVRQFQGAYADWDRRASAEAAPPPEEPRPARAGKPRREPSLARQERPTGSRPDVGGLSLKALEERIERIESRIAEIDRLIVDPDVYTDGPRCKALQAERADLAEQLVPLEFEWSRRAEA
jgi:ATP-binding cassette subfamily F protein 3